MAETLSQENQETIDSLERLLEALESMGDDLASRAAGDLSFRVTVQEDYPALKLLGELINKISMDWEVHVQKEQGETQRRTEELSLAYDALQSKNEELHRDLETAKRIQLQLLPQIGELPNRPELEFSAFYQSMEKVGGDLYDLIRVGRNSYGLIVADVSGHGIPSALLTMLLKAAFRTRARWGVETSLICQEVNSVLFPVVNELGFFATAFLGIIDLETGVFRYTNCGHNPIYFYKSKTEELIELTEGGMILGPFEDVQWEQAQLTMESNDVIFAFTDGIPEARNFLDEMYSEEQLKKDFIKAVKKNELAEDFPKKIIENIKKSLNNFTMGNKPKDDQTMAVFRFLQTTQEPFQVVHNEISQDSKSRLNRALVNQLKQKARTAVKEKNYEQAKSLLKAVIALDPNSPLETYLLAVIHHRSGRLDKARELALKVKDLTQEGSDLRKKIDQFMEMFQL